MVIRPWKLAILVPFLATGCASVPQYQRPAAPTPPDFKEMAGNDQWKMATPSDNLSKGKWWEIFGDSQLNQLEEQVNINNQTLKQAEAQFREARAVVAANHANYYPTITALPTMTQENIGVNAGNGKANSFVETAIPPVDTIWEPDLWHRVRLSVQNATANAQVSAADLENVRLSEQALLATDYFSLVAEDMQETVLTDTIAAYRQNLQLTQDRFNGGVASRSDITLAQTELDGALAQSTDVHVLRSQLEHAIAVLTGQPPSALTIAPGKINTPPPPIPNIPTAMPSQLLERRPDIAAAERDLAAANANVGLAVTAYYPTLTLSADPALVAYKFANLFTWAARSWIAQGSLSETVADFGRRHAAVQEAQATYDAAVASYRQTVLSAFQEVEDDLATLRYLAEEAGQQADAVMAAQEALDLELDRYRAGTDSYLSVIETQTILLGDQETAVTILERRQAAAVDLIKAVGGGWDASALPSGDAIRTVDRAPCTNNFPPCQ